MILDSLNHLDIPPKVRLRGLVDQKSSQLYYLRVRRQRIILTHSYNIFFKAVSHLLFYLYSNMTITQ